MLGGGLSRQVETVFTVADRATAPARGITSAFSGVASAAAKVGGVLGGLSVAGFLKSVVDIGSEFEETTNSIAGNLKAFGLAATMKDAQTAAARALDVIDSKAAKLPGEAEDYVNVFKKALPKAIESGLKDMTKIAEFTSQYTAVAIGNQVEASQAADDLFRMLAGRVELDTQTFAVLAPHIGKTAAEFNKLSIAQRRLAIENVIGKFADTTANASEFAGSKIGELVSMYRKLIREGSKPLFEGIKKTLTEVNTLISQNQVAIQGFIQAFSEKLLVGIRNLPAVLETVFKHMDEIKTTAEIFAKIWVGATLASGINNIITLMKSLETAIIAVNAAAAGGYLSRFAVGVAGVAAAAGGAAFLLPSEGGSAQEVAREKEVMAQYRAQQAATAERQRKIAAMGATYTDIASRIGGLMGGMGNVEALYKQAGAGKMGFKPADVLTAAELLGYAADDLARLADATSAAKKVAAAGADGKGKGTSVNIQNARFDIKQSFAEGYDPDRIAVAFTDTLAKLGEYRGQSSFSLTGAMP